MVTATVTATVTVTDSDDCRHTEAADETTELALPASIWRYVIDMALCHGV